MMQLWWIAVAVADEVAVDTTVEVAIWWWSLCR